MAKNLAHKKNILVHKKNSLVHKKNSLFHKNNYLVHKKHASINEQPHKSKFSIGKLFLFDKKEITGVGAVESLSKKYTSLKKGHDKQKTAEKKRKQDAEKQRELIKTAVTQEKPQPEKASVSEPLLPRKKQQPRKKRTFKQLLVLGGIEEDPIVVYKKLFLATIYTTLVLTALSLTFSFVYTSAFSSFGAIGEYLGFLAALWTAVFAAIFIFYVSCFVIYLDLCINKRRKDIEAVFPDYLQLAAANLSAGMTIDQALYGAVRPRFGVLAKEIEDVAKKTITGYDLERSLHEFSDKYDSIVLKRSISLIIEGIHSGGRLADILNKIAINIQENAILQKEMAANVTTYVIFISFASIAAAPFLFGLATQLLLVIQTIAGSISMEGGSTMGLSINPNVISLGDFKIFSIVVLSATALMSACIVSVIRKGTVKDGFRLLPFFLAVAISLYFIALWMLGFLFSDILLS